MGTAAQVADGAAWDRGFILRVAGITIAVESGAAGPHLAAAGCASRFLSDDDRPPDLALRTEWRSLSPEPPGRLVFDSGGTWRLYAHESGPVYRCFDPLVGPAPYKEAWLEAGETRGTLSLDPEAHRRDEPVDALQFPLDELLFLRLLAARGGVELHACGVVSPAGRGYVFAGHSGDGKTTTARLWAEVPGTTVLSDDRVVLRNEAGIWWIHGTPWHGEGAFAVNARAPLAGILLLAHAEGNTLEPIAPLRAVSGLFARSFVPLHDPSAVSTTLALLERVVRDVPCFRFPFTPGAAAVRLVLGALEG